MSTAIGNRRALVPAIASVGIVIALLAPAALDGVVHAAAFYASPDFTVSATPTSRTVGLNGSTTYAVKIGSLNGFRGNVALALAGLPAGASASFSPASVAGSASSLLTVVTTVGTQTGTGTLTISGTSGSRSHTARVTLTVATMSISGVISPSAAGAGATVQLGGTSAATTTADQSGAYRFSRLINGNYLVLPQKTGYAFTPTSRTVTVKNANLTAVSFAAQATYTISGTITPLAGGAGATVMLIGPSNATTTADSSGHFSFAGLVNGTYSVTPRNGGYTFTPSSSSVTVNNASVSGVTFTALGATALGPTMARANSYDNAWKSAWVDHGRALLTTPGKTAGFVLEIGDSITHSRAYSAWAIQGQGMTADDALVAAWARSTTWSSTNTDPTSKNGWYLTGADTTTQRGMTSSGGLSSGELVTGCCNNGPAMPAAADLATARQLISSATYTGNIQIDTLVAAFRDAQFAVVMLGTNDPGNPTGLADLASIVDRLDAAGILTILSTIPPRNDSFSDQLNVEFNAGVKALAQARSLPLIDFYQEIVLRRPDTTWFNTLIWSDGVHPTGDRAGFTVTSNPYLPGGDPATLTTGDALANVGYLLRSWLTIQKLKEVKRYVVDGVNPP